jgi:hypothetical protein
MSSTCYICLDEIKLKNKKEKITSMGCVCKGSIGVHNKCFTSWLDTTRDPFNCPVCKTGFSGKFMKNFFTEEEILFHGDNVDEMDDDDFVMEIINSVPVFFDQDENMYFESKIHESIYISSSKRELSGIRNECQSRKKFASKTIKRFHKKQYQFRR